MLQPSRRQKCTKSGLPLFISFSIPFIAAKCHDMSSRISDGFLLSLCADARTELCFWSSGGTSSNADSVMTSDSKIVF